MSRYRSHLFTIVYGAGLAGLLAYGGLALALPAVLLPAALSGELPPGGAAYTYLTAFARLIGCFNLILGALGTALLRWYLRAPDRRLLLLVIATTLLAYSGPLVFDHTVGTIGPIEVVEHLLFAMMVLSGLGMLLRRPAHRP